MNEGTRARHRLKGEKNDQRWHSSSGIVSVFFFFYLFTSFQYCFPTLGKHTCLRKCLGGREQFEYYLDIFTAAYIPYTQCRLCFLFIIPSPSTLVHCHLYVAGQKGNVFFMRACMFFVFCFSVAFIIASIVCSTSCQSGALWSGFSEQDCE